MCRLAYLDLANQPHTRSTKSLPADYGVTPSDALGPINWDHSALCSLFSFEDPDALAVDEDTPASLDTDTDPISFPSLLPRDYTAPTPMRSTTPFSDASSDSDFSPPRTPDTELAPLPHYEYEYHKRPYVHPIATAPLADELFAPDTAQFDDADQYYDAPPKAVAHVPPPLDVGAAYAFARLCMAEAYLLPALASPSAPLCIYDPLWHDDAALGLPRVCVHGDDEFYAPVQDDGEEQDWDRLVVPPKIGNGRMSDADEEFYFHIRQVEETVGLCFGDVVCEGEGAPPRRVGARRWLWKNF